MIDVRDAPASGGFHLGEGGVGMPRIAADAMGPATAHERLSARQLRSDGRPRDAIEAKVLFVFGQHRRADRTFGMAAARFPGEVGPVEVRAEDARSAGVLMS